MCECVCGWVFVLGGLLKCFEVQHICVVLSSEFMTSLVCIDFVP